MHGVALKGIAVLKDCLEPIKDPKTVDLLLVNYFENAMKFCVSTKDQTAVINKFNEHFEDWKMDSKGSLASSAQEHSEPFDILKFCDQYSPLGYELPVFKLISKKKQSKIDRNRKRHEEQT